MRPTPAIARDNARIDTCAAIIRAHLPSPEFFYLVNARIYVGSEGFPWDLLGTDPALVAVARCVVAEEVAS